MSEPDPINDFADRAFREVLEDVDNLRAFLREVLGPIADGFDVAHRKVLPRDFLLPSWKGRERDLLFEIPYRLPNCEELALVCVLIEHQTKPNPLMPLRMLIYAVFYWEKRLRAWESSKGARSPFQIPPVVPVVLHASPTRWTGPRELGELLGEPSAFHSFAPVWKPVFWEVGDHSADELLHNEDAFLLMMAIVKVEDDERDEALRVYREFLIRLATVRQTSNARWTHLLRFALGWVLNRRPRDEKQVWVDKTLENQNDILMREEIENMKQTIAQSWVEEGIKIGEERGEKRGEKRGEIIGLLRMIVKIGTKRLGQPTESVQEFLQSISEIDRLDRIADQVQEITSWQELLERETP